MPVPMTEEEQTQAIKDLAKTAHTHPNLGALSNIAKAPNGSMTFYGVEMANKLYVLDEIGKATGASGVNAATQTALDAKADLGADGKVLPEQLPQIGGVNDDVQTALATKADLDANGKVLASQLPALAICDTFSVATEAEMLGLDAQRGDVAVRTDLSKSFILKADAPTVLDNWVELLTPSSPVTSVAGRVGAIVLTKTDVGLPNVTNDAQIKAAFSGYTEKTSVVDGDWFVINAASDGLPYKVKKSNAVSMTNMEIMSYFYRG